MTRSSQWRWVGVVVTALVVGGWQGGTVYSAEHGGKEHGGQEHGGATTTTAVPAPMPAPAAPAASTTPASAAPAAATAPSAQPLTPSAEQIRQAIQAYVQDMEAEDGAFTIHDDVTDADRTLKFVRVHERVGKTGDYYYSCTDMQDTQSGEPLDLDFDVDAASGALQVVDVRIHKVNNQPRYTYDDQGRMIPVTP